jgi:hypothetical protein
MKTPMFSKKTLVPVLIKNGFVTTENVICYEAYGHRVMAYIHVKDMGTRIALENFLTNNGQKVNRNYYPGSPNVEVQVTYFKAHGWDE